MTKKLYEHHNEYLSLQADSKTYWVSDSKAKGLRLQINVNGTKYWRFGYRFGGKQYTLAAGTFPSTSIKEAREIVKKARDDIKAGVNPAERRQQEKEDRAKSQGNTFGEVAKAWHEYSKKRNARNEAGSKDHWTPKTANNIWARIDKYLMPSLGKRPISSITPSKVLLVMERVEDSGCMDTARRVFRNLKAILDYAKFRGLIESNPADGAESHLGKPKINHQPAIQVDELPELLNSIDAYTERGQRRGQPLTQLALQLLMRTLVRSGELRGARWEEFDLASSTWTIPAARMKKKREHLVPLSRQALSIILQIKSLSGTSEYLFPSKSADGVMSDNTLRKALFTLGYDGKDLCKSKCVPHGFRALGATILTEAAHPAVTGAIPERMFHPDIIEVVLAHQQVDRLKKAYIRHPNHLELRRHMMQWLSDYFDQCQGHSETNFKNVSDLTERRINNKQKAN